MVICFSKTTPVDLIISLFKIYSTIQINKDFAIFLSIFTTLLCGVAEKSKRIIPPTISYYILLRGGRIMNYEIENRAEKLGEYIIDHNATVRGAAQRFGVSKSTVHKDVSQRLRALNPALYAQVRRVLDANKSERHIRGGMATKKKYLLRKKLDTNC